MGLILSQKIKVTLAGRLFKYYTDKGYEIPMTLDNENRLRCERGTKIFVDILDLPLSSNYKVAVECDICKNIKYVMYNKYNRDFTNNEYICPNIRKHKEINLQNDYNKLLRQLKEFDLKYGRFPKYNEYTQENGLDSYNTYSSIAKMKNMKLNEMLAEIDCLKCTVPFVKYYSNYVEELKKQISIHKPTSLWEFIRTIKTCPDIRWLIDNCPNNEIKSSDDFLNWIGLYNPNISKESVIELIYNLQSKLNRPLMYDDFRGVEYGKPTIEMIKKYWGTLNNMKKELGLEINQESMLDRQMDIFDVETKIKKICESVYQKDGRKTLTSSDFNNRDDIVSYGTISKYIKQNYNLSMDKYLNKLGFSMVNSGDGLHYEYNDGEQAISKYEYLFSNYLRSLGLKYNKDYFRDVHYKDIISNHYSARTCDYKILYNDRIIFIEIAGMLSEYKTWYYDNRIIESSKSKEAYRVKLKEKEELLKNNSFEYFFLFPCDLTREFLISILNDDYNETKSKIEMFYKNNIKWGEVLQMGELKYDTSIVSRDGNYPVDYTKVG